MGRALSPPDKVLVFLLSGLGDTLMFTPALRLMRLAWPETKIVALTMRVGERDALETNSDLNEVRFHPFLQESMTQNLRCLAGLQNERYDLAILPCPTNRIHYNLMSLLCGATERAGFRYLRESFRNMDFLNTLLLPHEDHVHNAEHNLRLVERLTGLTRAGTRGWQGQLVLKTTDSDHSEAWNFIHAEGLDSTKLIGLHVSSSRAKHMERKCWPKERFLELIRGMAREDQKFLLFCGDEDLAESEWLCRMAGGAVRVARQIPIRVITELMRACRALVTNDSGLHHVAAAAGVPSVVIFGPTNPGRTGPWMSNSEVVRTGIECSPCFYHSSSDLTCPRGIDFACLKLLEVEQVRKAVERIAQI